MNLPGRITDSMARIIEIRRGERARTVLMFLYLFFVLMAYYVLKPSSESLFLTCYSADALPYLYLVVAAAGGPAAYFYSRLTVSCSLNAAVNTTIALVCAGLLGIWQLLRFDQGWIYYLFNVFVSLFSLVLVSQGWLIASHVFNPREAKRTYSILAAGAMLGSAVGGSLTAKLTGPSVRLGTANLVPVSAAMVVAAWMVYQLLTRQDGVALTKVRATEESAATFTLKDLTASILGFKHLQIIIGLITVTLIVDTLAKFQFMSMAAAVHKGDNLTAFLGGFYGVYLSAATFVLQILLTSFVVNRYGVGGTLMIMPAVIGAASAAMIILPGIWTAAVMKMIEAANRYSLNRTGMELLYLPLPDELRERTKTFVDVFVDRLAKGLGAILILVAGFLVKKAVWPVALLVLICCAVWLWLAARARREYVATVRRRLDSRRLDLEGMRIPYQDTALIQAVEQLASGSNQRMAVYAITLLSEVPAYPLEALAMRIKDGAPAEVRAKLYEMGREFKWGGLVGLASEEVKRPAGAALVPALAYLIESAQDPREFLEELLANADLRIVEAAVTAATQVPGEDNARAVLTLAWISQMADRPDPPSRRIAAKAFRLHPEEAAGPLFLAVGDEDPGVRRAAADTLVSFGARAVPVLTLLAARESTDLALRQRAVRVLGQIELQAAADGLTAVLATEDLPLHNAVLRALKRIRERVPSISISRGFMNEQIRNELRQYLDAHASLDALRKQGNQRRALALLIRSLEARTQVSARRIFSLLSLHYPHKDIDVAFRAFERQKGEELAHAIEFLDNVLDQDVKKTVLPLLDLDPSSGRPMLLKSVPEKSAQQAIEGLILAGNPWMSCCAMTAAAECRLLELAPVIRAGSDRHGPATMAVAEQALGRLSAAGE